MNKKVCLSLSMFFVILLGATHAQKSSQPTRTSITTWLDKTAIWVGDPLTYTIRVMHDKDVEFITDNLKKEELSLSPFVVRSVTIRQGEWTENKRLLEITLLLNSYETGKTDLTIAPVNLFYLKHEPGLAKTDAPAESVQVPATKVGLRSTLGATPLKPRDFRPVSRSDPSRILTPLLLGLAGLIFVASRCGRSAWLMLRSESPPKRRDQQARSRLVQESLARIRSLGEESAPNSLRLHSEISSFLRQYLSLAMEIEAASFTPEEIASALENAGANGSLTQQIRAILEQCDQVLYGRDSAPSGSENQAELLKSLERVVTSLQPAPTQ